MMYQTQILWLEETEDSIKAIEDAEHRLHELGLSKTKIPAPIFILYSKKIEIDLTMVVSISIETITLGDKEYTLPQLTFVNGEIHTLNEHINGISEIVLKAKKQERLIVSSVPRPIESNPEE